MADEETTTVVENADEATEVVTPEAAPEAAPTEEAEAEPDTESEPESEEVTAKPKMTAEQKKIAKQEKMFRDVRRENKRLAKMLEQSIENTAKAKPKIEAPKIENFDSMDEYLDARDEYRDSKRETKKETKQESIPAQETFDDMVMHGSEKHEDFEDMIQTSKISGIMAESVLEIDDPDIQVDVAYFLAMNPKEAVRISKLSEKRQIAEVGKLEIKVQAKPAPVKQVSKAPKPIKPVGGTKTSNDEIQPVESFDSFMKKRNKQLGRT